MTLYEDLEWRGLIQDISSPELKKKLENYIHPLVKQSIKAFISKNKTEKLIIIEVPLMFEQKIYTLFGCLVGRSIALGAGDGSYSSY